LKDQYFFKNFLSAFGFFITCFGYPLAMAGYEPKIGWAGVIVLILFFMPYELTFEIFYDLRDVEGDRQAGVKTYPVVHGQKTSEKIIYGLLAWSAVWLVAAFFFGFVGAREALMAAGPVLQFFLLRPLIQRGATISDCVQVTHYGSALLAYYLFGTAAWLLLGLPPNLYL
jgi:4-hydroxybenzoate polyprenyltransferase